MAYRVFALYNWLHWLEEEMQDAGGPCSPRLGAVAFSRYEQHRLLATRRSDVPPRSIEWLWLFNNMPQKDEVNTAYHL